jgi:hypothetical protein
MTCVCIGRENKIQEYTAFILFVVSKRPVTASLFKKSQCHNTLSANVEIGVPRLREPRSLIYQWVSVSSVVKKKK